MDRLAAAAPFTGSSGSTSHQGLAFSLSKLLAQKMAGGAGGLKGKSGGKGRLEEEEERTAFIITRCPSSTLARLDTEGGCFCGKLESDSTTCGGVDENDRRAVCVEDLREDAQRVLALEGKAATKGKGKGKKVERSKRRRATCGLEFLAGHLPEIGDCPAGYARIGDPTDEEAPFICQDTASPYSCGLVQQDCYAQPGVLQADCIEGACEIMMCQEGWRFHYVDSPSDDGVGLATCIPSKPLFFAPPP
ncbi:hypothetical protein JCM11251_003504 [Rhodosporidiobolus azoricus]